MNVVIKAPVIKRIILCYLKMDWCCFLYYLSHCGCKWNRMLVSEEKKNHD
jgi:hypothetical protein